MSYLFRNVFYPRDKFTPDEFINGTYWVFILVKNIFKWIYAVSLLKEENFSLLILLFLCPLIKFVTISLGNLFKFRKSFRGNLIFVILLILIIECFYELPVHILFPLNRVYLHTNYFKIYDMMKYRRIQISMEAFENFILLVFLFFSFLKSNIHFSSIVLFCFTVPLFLYYIAAEFYFTCCFDPETAFNQKKFPLQSDQYFTKIRNSKDLPQERMEYNQLDQDKNSISDKPLHSEEKEEHLDSRGKKINDTEGDSPQEQ